MPTFVICYIGNLEEGKKCSNPVLRGEEHTEQLVIHTYVKNVIIKCTEIIVASESIIIFIAR